MKLAVVILNWNGKKLLEQFLPSVIKNTPKQFEIVVVDNASSDDSLSFLKQNFPNVKNISLKENFGFAKGYNEALKQVDAEYYAILNSDVEVTDGWILPVLELMDSDKSIAACQPKILSYKNKNQFEYAGAAGGFIDKYGYAFCRGRIFNSFEEDKGQYDDAEEIFWASGAALFIRSDIFHAVGGFDEDFFAHMEEIDLCWRIKNRGYKIVFCPYSFVYHVGGATLSKINPHKTYLNFRNNLILLCKNHSSEYFLIKLLLRMKLDGLAGIKFLLSGEFSNFKAVLKAHFSFYSTLKSTIRKRKEEKKHITQYATTGVYNGTLIIDYFLLRKTKFSQLNKSKFN